jgi:MSHA biogenesis protein MshK
MLSGIMLAGLAIMAALAAEPAGLTDPTRPVDYLPASARTQPLPEELVDWRLSAVRIAPEGTSAILNGKVVRVGDAVGTARILEIKPGVVVVEYNRKRLEVSLFGTAVKRQAKGISTQPKQQ